MTDWAKQALCCGSDTSMFFPEQGSGTTREAKEAISMCKKCPVRVECLMHALNLPESFGIWGGLTYRNRLKILRKYQFPVSYENVREVIGHYDKAL